MKLKAGKGLLGPQKASVHHRGTIHASRQGRHGIRSRRLAYSISAREEGEWGHKAPRPAPGEPPFPTRPHSLKVLQSPQRAPPAGDQLCKHLTVKAQVTWSQAADTVKTRTEAQPGQLVLIT